MHESVAAQSSILIELLCLVVVVCICQITDLQNDAASTGFWLGTSYDGNYQHHIFDGTLQKVKNRDYRSGINYQYYFERVRKYKSCNHIRTYQNLDVKITHYLSSACHAVFIVDAS